MASVEEHEGQVTVVIVGAGNRGMVYQQYALEHPQLCKVVAVADPVAFRRNQVARNHGLEAERIFESFEDLEKLPRIADCVVIAVQDRLHCHVAQVFVNKGYHVLLEKPMAVSVEDCQAIYDVVKKNNVILAVGHVMRYTSYSQKFKELVKSGLVGDVVNIQHLEPVGFYHFAHSYVRGNWRREDESSFSLLTKSCHDIDWIRWVMGKKCNKVSSFGSLFHFRSANKPAGAASRCLDCPVENTCCYSAKKIYLDPFVETGKTNSFLQAVVDVPSPESITEALSSGPYGRCVFESDNDVVDNQVVNMEFEGGSTASFTMIAFSKEICVRKTKIFGTLGVLEGDGSVIRHFDFLTQSSKEFVGDRVAVESKMRGHDFGDYHLMKDFVRAVSRSDPSLILSGPEETLESHMITFAAEASRRSGCVVALQSGQSSCSEFGTK